MYLVCHLMSRISSLKNLADKSEQQLAEVGITTAEQLIDVGSAEAYVQLKMHFQKGISLNFLYAMEAAIRGIHWQEITQQDKLELQLQAEALLELYFSFEKHP